MQIQEEKTTQKNQITLLHQDLIDSFLLWRFWIHMGWDDIAKQYRRSFLGPIWITLNTSLFIVFFGFIGAQIFKIEIEKYLPYFCLGHISFSFIHSITIESCNTFIAAETFLKQIAYPKLSFCLKLVWKNIILFAHNLPIVFFVLLWSNNNDTPRLGDFAIALIFTSITGTLVAAILGTLSARYRDVPMIVSSLMQVSFFVTPVMWQRDQLTERAKSIVDLNPLAAFLDILRSPLLGNPVSPNSWPIAIGSLAILIVLFYTFFLKSRKMITYWI